MSRIASLFFAIACYAIFFATFLYLIVFVGDFSFATVTVDNGPLARPAIAAVVDVELIGGKAWMGGNLFYRRDPGHVANSPDDLGAALRFSMGF